MSIDWSKAPEGATHYRKGNSLSFFRDVEKSGFYFWNEHQPQWRWVEGAFPADAKPIAPTWNGEGLPPVGTVCEHEGSNGWSNSEVCEVIAHRAFEGHADGELLVVCATKTDVWFSSACCFRPIRTPEQIAAEKRDKAIKEMAEDLGIMHTTAAQAYDKGYRKIES